MFERLRSMVEEYNKSGRGKAALQEFDANTGKAFILCVVTGLMCRVHEKIPQAHELCYMDASASFELLNTSITLLYDLNRDLDPTARVKSCSMIRVQAESFKRRKIEGSGGRKRKLPNIICEEKENFDPHVIPARKKKTTAKKGHNISMNIVELKVFYFISLLN